MQTLIITRESDLKAYSDRLRSENNNYSANLKIHDDIVVRIYFYLVFGLIRISHIS